MRRIAILILALTGGAVAAPAPPTGPHPRLLLTPELRSAWRASTDRGPVKAAIGLCQHARDTAEHDRAVYMGSEWSKVLQACLVAWAATDDASYAKTGVRFFTALLDDLDRIGDGLGGDPAALRDSGYAIRNLGPYTALAYDWFHAVIPPATRERAVMRWAAWLDGYAEKGYRARVPGTNYQAGYLLAATAIAIAQAGEAGDGGPTRWAFVADELWGNDMAAALAPGGILDGGDWPEGWQYGPLAVASYALAARMAKAAGITVDAGPWLESVLRRHVYGSSPSDGTYAGGDTEAETPTLEPAGLTLSAVALGDAPRDARAWAKGELARLQLADADFLLFSALATVGDAPALAPRASWPTAYVAPATGTLYARTRWDNQAMWFVAECQHTLEVDHRSPNAGTFVLSRGVDDVIVDPTPYGSRSSLTGNAPTVASAQLPPAYLPSQGYWGKTTAWAWTAQTRSGVVAARCNYADQYRFQEHASDVPAALRDFVLVPSADGTAATLVVIDRATTGAADRSLHVRFRTTGALALVDHTATALVGRTQLAITTVSGGTPVLGASSDTDCFKDESKQGRCDAGRFAVRDLRLEVPGPEPRAVHAIGAAGRQLTAPILLGGDGYQGIAISGPRAGVVVWPTTPGVAALAYRAPIGTVNIVLDGPDAGGTVTVSAARAGNECAIMLSPGGTVPARPAIFTVDAECRVTADPPTLAAVSAARTQAPLPTRAGGRRGGCCQTAGSPTGSLAPLGVVVLGALRRRRRATPSA